MNLISGKIESRINLILKKNLYKKKFEPRYSIFKKYSFTFSIFLDFILKVVIYFSFKNLLN